MSTGFSFIVSSYRLVGRLVPYRRRGGRSWRVSVLAVLLVGVSSWRRRHSFVLRRGVVVLCLVSFVARPSRLLLVVSSRGASRCSFPMSCGFGRLIVSCPSHLIVLLISSGGASLFPASAGRLVSSVSWGGEVFASRFIPARASGMDGGSRLARLVGRCFLAFVAVGHGEAMPFSSSVFPSASYYPMGSYGRGTCARASFPFGSMVACFLFSWAYRSCLVPFVRFEQSGREAGCLAIGAWVVDRCI